ncbi:MAG: type IV pilin [Haloferacaceae archaeon]
MTGGRSRARVGVPVALALAAVLGTVVAAVALGALPADRPTAALTLRADAGTDRLVVTHRAGEPLAPDRLSVHVRVDGRPLAHQPPVPFFAAEGFRSGPTGPFNSRAAGAWTRGERAGLRLAATNRPALRSGRRVTVVVRVGEVRVARLTAVAR